MEVNRDCLFCKIAQKTLTSKIIYENDHVLAFNDISPKAPIHILIIPKVHYSTFQDVDTPGIYENLFSAAKAICKERKFDDFRLVINNGEMAGQTVFHLHLHLLAGRQFNWPPG